MWGIAMKTYLREIVIGQNEIIWTITQSKKFKLVPERYNNIYILQLTDTYTLEMTIFLCTLVNIKLSITFLFEFTKIRETHKQYPRQLENSFYCWSKFQKRHLKVN